MGILKEDISKLKSDLEQLHKDVAVALDHLEYHLGVKRMDENDIHRMQKHLKKMDRDLEGLIEHAGLLEEKQE
ncbi:MAG TPA: hypothetical protein ENJ43_04100 [Gammaproteobacteria bacterium]|nr:hypothetical protein [Gammaproteobacteria bacterium]